VFALAHTLCRFLSRLDDPQAVSELVRRAVELLEGVGEVFELVVELLLDLGELLLMEGVEVDCGRVSQSGSNMGA
jgi:hypothetical protein